VVSHIASLLGAGEKNILTPLLVLLGFVPKKVAVTVSFVVPFSALGFLPMLLMFQWIGYCF